MTAILPERAATVPAAARPAEAEVRLHVDDALGIADVSVVGAVDPRRVAAVVATVSCRLHAAIGRATTTVVLDLTGASGLDAAQPALERVLACAREGAAARGLTLDRV